MSEIETAALRNSDFFPIQTHSSQACCTTVYMPWLDSCWRFFILHVQVWCVTDGGALSLLLQELALALQAT